MPLVRKEGKDTIIFATKEDHASPSTLTLPDPEPNPGLILPNGEVNWNCPCLGGMATGPCGLEFREAFTCFHYSTTEPKGADCYDDFKTMQACMVQYPTLYNKDTDISDLGDDEEQGDHENRRKLKETALESKNEDKKKIASSETKIEHTKTKQ